MNNDPNSHRTNRQKHGSIQYYTPDETRRMMKQQSEYDHRNKYNKAFKSNSQKQPNTPQMAYNSYKKRRRHRIESWIGVVASLATIVGVGITILGHYQNSQKSQPQRTTNTKVYEDRSAPNKADTSSQKPEVHVQKEIDSPRKSNTNSLKQKIEHLQDETSKSKQQAKNSAQFAEKEANSLKSQVQSGQATQKMSQKINDLEQKLKGYEQDPNAPQPYDNNNQKFPTNVPHNQ